MLKITLHFMYCLLPQVRVVDALRMSSTGVPSTVRSIATVQELQMDVIFALEINALMVTDQEEDAAGIASMT